MNECKCWYCTKMKWPLIRQISSEYNWVEIPKNGSSSIKEHIGSRAHVVKDVRITERPVLCFVRHPIARFISVFNHYFADNKESRYQRGIDFFTRMGHDINKFSIEERVDFLIQHFEHLNYKDECHHFYPQSYFVNGINNLEIYDVSHINDMFPDITSYNVSRNGIRTLSDENSEWVLTHYKSDIELYKQRLK